jgi:hypothetical protein
MLFKGLDQYFADSTQDGKKNQTVFHRADKSEGNFVLYPKVEEHNFLLDFWEDLTSRGDTEPTASVQAFTCEAKISEITMPSSLWAPRSESSVKTTSSPPFCMTLELTRLHFPNPHSWCARGFHIRELFDYSKQVLDIGNPESNYLACDKWSCTVYLPFIHVVIKSIFTKNYKLPQTLFLLDRKRYQAMQHILAMTEFIPELVEICFLFECSTFVDTVPSLGEKVSA